MREMVWFLLLEIEEGGRARLHLLHSGRQVEKGHQE